MTWLVVKRSSVGKVSGWDGLYIVDADSADKAIEAAAHTHLDGVQHSAGLWIALEAHQLTVRLAAA